MSYNSPPFPHEASQVELLPGNLETEFTPQQIANFKQAFGVFDVNKDGRISTTEIFEVLQTMGNEVSLERQNKIKAAVVAVDVDRSGDLDFAEFIQFMKIMDEHNKSEAVQKLPIAEGNDGKLPRFYAKCFRFEKMSDSAARISEIWWNILIILGCLYSLGHAIFIGVIIAFDWNPQLHQNPGTDTSSADWPDSNTFATYILYARYANYANAVLVVQFFLLYALEYSTNKAESNAVFVLLKRDGYRASGFNLVKYILRPIFVLNYAISIVFIGGTIGVQPTIDSIQSNWVAMVFPAAVIVVAHFSLSEFLYFNSDFKTGYCSTFCIMLLDVLCLNWFRLIFRLLKNVLAIVMLPFALLLTLVMLLSCKCENCFNLQNEGSKTNKFFRMIVYLQG